MPFPPLPPRTLDQAELRALVDALAESRETGRPDLVTPERERDFVSLHRDDFIDVWLIAWRAAGDTGWHDHDLSAGAVRVVSGALHESSPRLGGTPAERVIAAGETFSFGPEHIHRLEGHAEYSVSIHAYSPPLCRLGQYTIDDDGVMRRMSISYTEELRARPEPVAA